MTDNDTKKIKFDQIKSPAFRTVHADGVWGGVTPHGYINMGFFSERSPFPRQVTHGISEDQRLSDEIKEDRIGRDAIVREIECNVIIDARFAKSLVKWLQDKIKDINSELPGGE